MSPTSSHKSEQLLSEHVLCDDDVPLRVREAPAPDHKGSIFVKALVELLFDGYQKVDDTSSPCTPLTKTDVIDVIISMVHNRGGLFKEKKGDKWVKATDHAARQNVSRLFSDLNEKHHMKITKEYGRVVVAPVDKEDDDDFVTRPITSQRHATPAYFGQLPQTIQQPYARSSHNASVGDDLPSPAIPACQSLQPLSEYYQEEENVRHASTPANKVGRVNLYLEVSLLKGADSGVHTEPPINPKRPSAQEIVFSPAVESSVCCCLRTPGMGVKLLPREIELERDCGNPSNFSITPNGAAVLSGEGSHHGEKSSGSEDDRSWSSSVNVSEDDCSSVH